MLSKLRERILTMSPSFPKVDREKCVVEGVKILGTTARDGSRIYPPDLIKSSAPRFEGKPSNINHQIEGHRKFGDRFGWITDVVAKDDGLYATLHYNPHIEGVEAFLWWCENNPNGCGFSIDALLQFDRPPNQPGRVVQEFIEIFSVDLVADPNTTEGITESFNRGNYMEPKDVVAGPAQEAEEIVEAEVPTLSELVGQIIAKVAVSSEYDEIARNKIIKTCQNLLTLIKGDGAAPTDTSNEEEVTQESFNVKLLETLSKLNDKIDNGFASRTVEGSPKPANPQPKSLPRTDAIVPPAPASYPTVDQLFGEAQK